MNKLNLIKAELLANQLFDEVEKRNYIIAGKSEKQLNTEIYNLAFEMFKINKFWHKRIIRSGKNTLLPYRENPPDLIIQEDDILFFDFGPVFEDWEADLGRTYVLGNNEKKLKLKSDVEIAWNQGFNYYLENLNSITCAQLFSFTQKLASDLGWEYGNEHCGHLIGNFPHENLLGDEKINYIHPENHTLMSDLDRLGNQRFWIYEIHFIDKELEIGGFYEKGMFDLEIRL